MDLHMISEDIVKGGMLEISTLLHSLLFKWKMVRKQDGIEFLKNLKNCKIRRKLQTVINQSYIVVVNFIEIVF